MNFNIYLSFKLKKVKKKYFKNKLLFIKITTILSICALLFSCQIKKNKKINQFNLLNKAYKNKKLEYIFLKKNNLWKYIFNKFTIQIKKNIKIKKKIQFYIKKKKYIEKIMTKAEPYIYYISDEIEKFNLPMELILIPFVESNFNPNAISKAKAKGIWQLIPSTANLYKLKENKWIDEKKDLILSTKVALILLKKLNERFQGNWILTFAAYNCGEKCIINAIKKNKKKEINHEFWNLKIPKETINYVAKIFALIHIFQNNKTYSLTPPVTNINNSLIEINIKKQITLFKIAKLTKTPLYLIQYYNSQLKRNITPPNGPHRIILPKKKIKIFIKNFFKIS